MGILYAWATKEYLLEKCSFGQIVMYLNEGLRFKYPKPQQKSADSGGSMVGMSDDKIRDARDKLRREQLGKQYMGE